GDAGPRDWRMPSKWAAWASSTAIDTSPPAPSLQRGWESGRPAGSREGRSRRLPRSESNQALSQAAAFGQLEGCGLEVTLANGGSALLRGEERRLPQQLLDVRRADSICPPDDAFQVDVIELQAPRIELEQPSASLRVR